jgi:hypothetical protein
VEVEYSWESVPVSLIVERWGEEGLKKARELRDAQYERGSIDQEEEEV